VLTLVSFAGNKANSSTFTAAQFPNSAALAQPSRPPAKPVAAAAVQMQVSPKHAQSQIKQVVQPAAPASQIKQFQGVPHSFKDLTAPVLHRWCFSLHELWDTRYNCLVISTGVITCVLFRVRCCQLPAETRQAEECAIQLLRCRSQAENTARSRYSVLRGCLGMSCAGQAGGQAGSVFAQVPVVGGARSSHDVALNVIAVARSWWHADSCIQPIVGDAVAAPASNGRIWYADRCCCSSCGNAQCCRLSDAATRHQCVG
jgi:hypothetical protein